MAVLRYASQEAANIKKAESRAIQQARLNASIAIRAAEDADALITKASLGLGNVDNTSDVNKPVSTDQQAALNGKLNTWVDAPATAASTGTAGQIAYDTSYLYVCTAANTWKRVGIATW